MKNKISQPVKFILIFILIFIFLIIFITVGSLINSKLNRPSQLLEQNEVYPEIQDPKKQQETIIEKKVECINNSKVENPIIISLNFKYLSDLELIEDTKIECSYKFNINDSYLKISYDDSVGQKEYLRENFIFISEKLNIVRPNFDNLQNGIDAKEDSNSIVTGNLLIVPYYFLLEPEECIKEEQTENNINFYCGHDRIKIRDLEFSINAVMSKNKTREEQISILALFDDVIRNLSIEIADSENRKIVTSRLKLEGDGCGIENSIQDQQTHCKLVDLSSGESLGTIRTCKEYDILCSESSVKFGKEEKDKQYIIESSTGENVFWFNVYQYNFSTGLLKQLDYYTYEKFTLLEQKESNPCDFKNEENMYNINCYKVEGISEEEKEKFIVQLADLKKENQKYIEAQEKYF
ncbi:hypothetical protein GF362_02550 [Candidatus Dojkabacteria bacterium]|nr:hypothetical protein [Candidatus Dojkabacteria bacterium]